jgi:hypothetical protein
MNISGKVTAGYRVLAGASWSRGLRAVKSFIAAEYTRNQGQRPVNLTAFGTKADKVALGIGTAAIAALPVMVTAEEIMYSLQGTGTFSSPRVLGSLAFAGLSAGALAMERRSAAHLNVLMTDMGEVGGKAD